MARDTVMKKPKDTRGALRRILQYLGPWKYVILGVVGLSLISNLLLLLLESFCVCLQIQRAWLQYQWLKCPCLWLLLQ